MPSLASPFAATAAAAALLASLLLHPAAATAQPAPGPAAPSPAAAAPTPAAAAPPPAAAPTPAAPPVQPPRIAVSQVGYLPTWDKDAFFVSASRQTSPASAHLVEAATGKIVAALPLGPPRRDPATGDWQRLVSFSSVRAPGSYRLVAAGVRSPAFRIGTAALVPLERLLLRSFYLQRCGVALHDRATGVSHGACHLRDAVLRTTDASIAVAVAWKAGGGGPSPIGLTSWKASGGWHDAGDYGKYVATTAVAIGRVLGAYERDPVGLGFDDLGIPESGNGVPDALDEMKVGLDWMLTMQRGDGAVYRKVGGRDWAKKLVPERDEQVRYVHGVTSPETAKAAAAWALAARLYLPTDPVASGRYLAAARRAWAWLEQQPAQVFDYQEGDDAGSGPYRSNKTDTEASLLGDADDRLWAATELALTTGEPRWLPIVEKLAAVAPVNLYEWKDPSLLALSYFLWHPRLSGTRTKALAQQIARRIAARAAAPLARASQSGYRIANSRFVWGSNKMTAEEGMILCLAYQHTGERELLAAARDQLHYLLGRNHFATSFVSGVGERSVRSVTHIFAEAAGVFLPGLLVGGPNELEQAGIAPRGFGERSWIDDRRSYSSNEYAIDYDASLLGLVAALERDCFR